LYISIMTRTHFLYEMMMKPLYYMYKILSRNKM
jgi:hypothetical protein